MNFVYLSATRSHCSYTESLLLPESKKLAKTYCSALCNLSGMCEFFMTTEDSKCPHGCNSKEDISEFMLFLIIIMIYI